MTATRTHASDFNLTNLRQRAPLPTLPALPALAGPPQPEGLADAAFNARLLLALNSHPSLEAHAHALVYALLHGQQPAELTLDLVAKVRADLQRQTSKAPRRRARRALARLPRRWSPTLPGCPRCWRRPMTATCAAIWPWRPATARALGG